MKPTPGISRIFRTLPTLRRGLLRNIVLLILVTGAAMVAVVVWEAYRTVAALSESLIDVAATQTATKLEAFFGPVTRNLLVARGRAQASALDVEDVQALNAIFIPELQQYDQVSSIMIADATGFEYMLLRSDDDWINRRVAVDRWGTRSEWHRWRGPNELLEQWTAQVEYDPRVRPWYVGAMDHASADVHWTEPYTFFTTKDPGITASIRWPSEGNAGPTHVLAFDVLLRDISSVTGELEVGERGTTVVLTEDLRVLGLPRDARFADPETVKASVLLPADSLGVQPLTDAVAAWEPDGERGEVPRKFTSGGETWWAGFRQFPLGNTRNLWLGVVVPEADILGPTLQRRNALVGITVVALVIGIGIAVLVDRGYQRRLSRAVLQVKQLGQYTLEEKIGEGGMGSVYRARHAMLRRPTAVKLVRPDQSQLEQALSRFEQEVQLTAGLSHPNTISVYDYGRTPDGIFYYAMEYLDGVTLQHVVDRTGPLPAERVIYVLQQICGSLAEAHAVGLIHRDIKPANVMLCEQGGAHDVVKVLDFGIVKDVDAPDDAELTAQGSVMGTPAYIAPEQITQRGNIDERSDLYLVGGVAYFMLTGTEIFPARNPMEALALHVQAPPDPPSLRAEGIPSDLEQIVLSCLEKRPEDRPPSVRALSAMLGRCGDAGRWDVDRAREWWIQYGEAARGKEAAPTASQDSKTILTIDLAAR